jgi:hypothetical protein
MIKINIQMLGNLIEISMQGQITLIAKQINYVWDYLDEVFEETIEEGLE